MSGLLFAFAVLSSLGPRPESLTGPLGQSAYKAAIDAELALDGIDVRIARYLGDCKAIMLESEGFDPVVDDSSAYFLPLEQFLRQSPEEAKQSIPHFPEKIILRPAAVPDGTAAIEHIRVTGCGKTYRLNFLGRYVEPHMMPVVNMMVPGHSLATPGIQARVDADVANLAQADRRTRPDIKCGMVPLVYDVRVVTPPVAGGAWREQWDSYYCEASQTTEVTFTPTPDGSMVLEGKLISSK